MVMELLQKSRKWIFKVRVKTILYSEIQFQIFKLFV